MDNVLNVLINYGAVGACLVYFMIKDYFLAKEIKQALEDLRTVILLLKERVIVMINWFTPNEMLTYNCLFNFVIGDRGG